MWKSLYANFKQMCWCPMADFPGKAFALSLGLEKRREWGFAFWFKEGRPGRERRSVLPTCLLLGDVPSITTREQ